MNQLLPAAERIAHDDRSDHPGAKHLVLAAIEHEDGIARRALEESGVTATRLRTAWEAQQNDALQSIGIRADLDAINAAAPTPRESRIYQSEPSQQALFQRAVAIAKSEKAPLSSGHIILAAAEDTVSELALVFDRLELDRAELRRRIGLRL